MDIKLFWLVSAMLLLTVLVEARRRPTERRRGNRVTPSRYTWTRELAAGTTVNEEATTPEDSNQMYVKSIDDRLPAAGFKKALLLYDFSGISPIVSVTLYERHRRGLPCYILDTNLTYSDVIATLAQRNNTDVGASPEISLDGSSPVLSRQAARELFDSNPSLRKACRGGRVARTSAAATASENTEVVKVLTLDSVLNLTIQGAANSTRPSRRGSRGRGRGSSRQG
ncbi:unnamed protein product [Candidula unifasciata]|uniref:Secreted protein n=1 Tax=Candidula unifasciata TaxID=100452 RepID=A0A8S3YF89_9EUPU|nr:unnamed protein product [Candidula unifasciata]